MVDHVSTEIGGALFEVGDRYEVLGLLGQGSFGTVANAKDRKTGKKLAIKHIHPIAGSRSGARHILREVSIMRALRYHPNIINLEDLRLDSNSSTLYIVMELMDCDLQRILASGQVLTAEHVKVLLKQLLLGVQAMHRQGFLHRDLKPANILLLSDCQLRITDFGLSRRIRTPASSSEDGGPSKNDSAADEFSLTGYVVTRWYRAPEVMLGPEGAYSEPVDVWSVGCNFGEMLGSRGALFPGENYIDQVSLTLAAFGNPGVESADALGYELSEDAFKFLRTVEPPNDRVLESLVPPDVDKEAFHLLNSLLDMNTRHRVTAQLALEHAFFRDCPRLPTATADSSVEVVGEDAPDFSFEDDDLTVEELGKLIAAQAAAYEDSRRESRRRTGSVESDASLNLQPTPSLKDVLGAVRSQARRLERKGSEVASEGYAEAVRDAAPNRGLGSLPRPTPTLEKRFSSMANLAEAEDGGVDPLDGSFAAGSGRDTSSVSCGPRVGTNRRCGGVVASTDDVADGTASSSEAGGSPGGGGQPPRMRESGEAASGGCSRNTEESQHLDFPAQGSIGAERHGPQRAQNVSASGPPSQPGSSDTERERDHRKCSAGSGGVADTEDAAATRIQPACQRRPAPTVAGHDRNKYRTTGERKVRPPPARGGGGGSGGGCRVTPTPQRATTQQQPREGSFLEERGEGSQQDRAAASSVGQKKTQRQAAEIRRERAEHEQCLQDKQFLFGPGFQRRGSLTNKRDSGAKSSSGSEGQQSRCRDVASLSPSEEEKRQTTRKSRAATKIQSQVRRKAASRRLAAARQGRLGVNPKLEKNAVGGTASMPRLQIDSLVHRQASSFRRPKVQREPLAILRQLRRDDSKAALKTRTDQFRLRLTVKSAIDAHVRKTGAARRNPRPLPTPPSWRWHQSMASMKAKSSQEQAAATGVRLAKPRPISPLHTTVRRVNKLIAAHKLRGQAGEAGPGVRRARSAPSRATDRLRCAIFAAETMVEREFTRAERMRSFGRTSAPADEFSGDLLGSPLLVPCQPEA